MKEVRDFTFQLIGVVVAEVAERPCSLSLLSPAPLQTVLPAAFAGATSNKAAWMASQGLSAGPFAYLALLFYGVTILNVLLRRLGFVTGLIGPFRSVSGELATQSSTPSSKV
ncbi:hypothetical protein PV08_11668 [Exophiala spinifera]|uniref:Uncharacterized protein n=1 Tax=Exophiala spinifera TaxID=91928 RepID=A0A0D2BH72_9EURO|nr:uncharacterized protein PV08_11668 [Exophiala spinifera]KIW10704.1 hypothetical protein PV08_11668 [Exophiala spinifera]